MFQNTTNDDDDDLFVGWREKTFVWTNWISCCFSMLIETECTLFCLFPILSLSFFWVDIFQVDVVFFSNYFLWRWTKSWKLIQLSKNTLDRSQWNTKTSMSNRKHTMCFMLKTILGVNKDMNWSRDITMKQRIFSTNSFNISWNSLIIRMNSVQLLFVDLIILILLFVLFHLI